MLGDEGLFVPVAIPMCATTSGIVLVNSDGSWVMNVLYILLKLFDSIINRREFEIKDGPASKEK